MQRLVREKGGREKPHSFAAGFLIKRVRIKTEGSYRGFAKNDDSIWFIVYKGQIF